MQSIPCVRDVRGRGTRVYLEINPISITAADLRELNAVYHRYGADLSQLETIEPIADEFDDADD
jgi:hypothetical protein